jgi:pantoate--beta-alanine ligase
MLGVEKSIDAVRVRVREARRQGKVIGLVPTMGALHAGHARLIEECVAASGFVVVSIFVNPMQFGPGEDLDRYPRTIEDDLRLCESLGTDLVFAPLIETMFPEGREPSTFVEVPRLSHLFEGAIRPIHFRGVATIVLMLFAIVEPDLAYFGAKDYQQQLIVKRMVADLNLPVEIRTIDTVREADGLALSSRNRYLDPAQRSAATVLHRALAAAQKAVADGETDPNRVRQILIGTIESEALGQLDYAEVVDARTLEPMTHLSNDRKAVALLAVRFGTTRLIDNAVLMDSGPKS